MYMMLRKATMASQRTVERILCLIGCFYAVAARRHSQVALPPCPRRCSCVYQNIDCSYRAFSSFPAGSWTDAWGLELNGNEVERITADNLRNFASLHILNVRKNLLKELNLASLEVLPYLTTVNMDHNVIKKVVSVNTHRALPRLMRVDLSQNVLSEFPLSLLDAAPNLRELRLSYNKMIKIPAMEHPELRILDISATGIPELRSSTFNGLRNLEELYLANNSLTTLGDNMRRMLHLKVLDISGNKFKRLEGSDLPPFQKLQILYVLYNPISVITSGTLEKALSTIGSVVDARGSLAACRCHLQDLQKWGSQRYVEVYAACPQNKDPYFCERSKSLPLKLVEETDVFKKHSREERNAFNEEDFIDS